MGYSFAADTHDVGTSSVGFQQGMVNILVHVAVCGRLSKCATFLQRFVLQIIGFGLFGACRHYIGADVRFFGFVVVYEGEAVAGSQKFLYGGKSVQIVV